MRIYKVMNVSQESKDWVEASDSLRNVEVKYWTAAVNKKLSRGRPIAKSAWNSF